MLETSQGRCYCDCHAGGNCGRDPCCERAGELAVPAVIRGRGREKVTAAMVAAMRHGVQFELAAA